MTDRITLTISTLAGAAVACSLRPRGPTETVVVSEAKVTTNTGAVVEGWLTAPHPVPDVRMPLMQKLRAAGASHYAHVEPRGGTPCTLALDDAAAAALTDAFARAKALALAGKTAADAERAAHLRANHEVRRVLCAEHGDASYELTEAAYVPDLPGFAPEWQARLRVAVPGAPSARVHMFAPSLEAIIARSEPWGCFAGTNNSLRAVSDADWDLLVRETAEIDARRRAKEAAERARVEAETAERERCRAAAAEGVACRVVERWTGRGEDGNDPGALVEVAVDGGTPLRFVCRTIFDFGYVVNPDYAVVPGAGCGGIAVRETAGGPLVWSVGDGRTARPLTPQEERALAYLQHFPPVSANIRM